MLDNWPERDFSCFKVKIFIQKVLFGKILKYQFSLFCIVQNRDGPLIASAINLQFQFFQVHQMQIQKSKNPNSRRDASSPSPLQDAWISREASVRHTYDAKYPQVRSSSSSSSSSSHLWCQVRSSSSSF